MRREILDSILRCDEEGVDGFPLKRAIFNEMLALFPRKYKIEDFLRPTSDNVIELEDYA